MTKEKRLKKIKEICEKHRAESFVGFLFAPQEGDINDEISRMDTKPDAEPNEEMLSIMDAVFEGGQ